MCPAQQNRFASNTLQTGKALYYRDPAAHNDGVEGCRRSICYGCRVDFLRILRQHRPVNTEFSCSSAKSHLISNLGGRMETRFRVKVKGNTCIGPSRTRFFVFLICDGILFISGLKHLLTRAAASRSRLLY